jgi:RNA polymerase sigma-70 factor (ECF subfamily)
MRRVQDGDQDAYTELLHAIAPRIRHAVRRRCGFLAAEAIEDLVQDVLMSLHATRATYDPSRPFAPWLAAIVRFRVADAARRDVRRQAHEVVVDELELTFSSEATKFAYGDIGEFEALRAAIESLPTGQRRAIQLLKLKEMSLKEASASTGMTVGALKLATHRAIGSLRRALRTVSTHED